ncbi:hypothetical protein AAZX31_19G239000 [Glycine max]|uniref:Uncharacterized protein n=1 Tax=Glycine soja TaxID=3848 RepID=A0A445FLH1_GLYSO|nr:hypothetical protein JHK84_054547 [Glycine max]KAH1196137.1 hypothetical protein GmHk_19G056473 [Glycine max]RZB49702.1 hypothetical protein D0Y65_052563 [Glycine soja]
MRTSSKEKAEAVLKWDCGSPLYDSYELVSLAYTIDRHMMAWPHLGGPNPIIAHPKEESSTQRVPKISSMVSNLSEFFVKIMRKRKMTPQNKHKKKIKAGCFGLFCG